MRGCLASFVVFMRPCRLSPLASEMLPNYTVQGWDETIIFNLQLRVSNLLTRMTGCLRAEQNATSSSFMMAGYGCADIFRHLWLDMSRGPLKGVRATILRCGDSMPYI